VTFFYIDYQMSQIAPTQLNMIKFSLKPTQLNFDRN